MNGPATREELHALHRLVTQKLIEEMRDDPSAEAMQCARRLVADSGVTADTEADRKALRRLHKLYLCELLRAMTDPDSVPPASLLAEVGHALRTARVEVNDKDPAAVRAVVDLSKLRLPFSS